MVKKNIFKKGPIRGRFIYLFFCFLFLVSSRRIAIVQPEKCEEKKKRIVFADDVPRAMLVRVCWKKIIRN